MQLTPAGNDTPQAARLIVPDTAGALLVLTSKPAGADLVRTLSAVLYAAISAGPASWLAAVWIISLPLKKPKK